MKGATASVAHEQNQWGSTALRVCAGMLVLAGLLLTAVSSLMSYGDVYSLLTESFPADTVRRHFSEASYEALRVKSQWGGIALALAGVWLAVRAAAYGRSLDRWVLCFRKDLLRTIRKFRFSFGRHEGIFLFAVTAGGAVLRWHFVDRVMRYDESVTFLRFASKPLYVALAAYNEPNNHIFHTLLVKGSVLFFGNSEWAIRLPALVAGVLLIPACYLIGRTSGFAGAGLWAASFAAVSLPMIEYSINARGYTLQAILCVVAAWFLNRGVEERRITYFAIFSICLALGFWTIPTMLFALVGMAGYFYWSVRGAHGFSYRTLQRWFWVSTFGALILTGILYIPVMLSHGPEAIVANPYVKSKAASAFLASNAREISALLRGLYGDYAFGLKLLIAISTGVAVVFGVGRKLFPLELFLSLLASTIAIIVAFRMTPPARAYLFLLPFYYCLAATGLGLLVAKVMGIRRAGAHLLHVGAVAFALAIGWDIWHGKGIEKSTETGVLISVREIASELKARNVCWAGIEGHYVSKTVLEYYWRESPNGPVDHCSGGPTVKKAVIVNAALREEFQERRLRMGAEQMPTEVLKFESGDILLITR